MPVERVPLEFSKEFFEMVIWVLERGVAAEYFTDVCGGYFGERTHVDLRFLRKDERLPFLRVPPF